MILAQDLRDAVLQAAIQGKLTQQLELDSSVDELLEKIRKEKELLIKEKKIKKEKPLKPISEDEIPFDIPDNWKWEKFGNLVILLSGQDFKPEEYNENNEGIPYLTGASNIDSLGNLIINRWTEKPTCIAKINDVLLVCKGSGYGKTTVCTIEKAHIARQFMAVKYSHYIDSNYVKVFLESRFILIKEKGQGVIPGIDRGSVLNLLFPLPPFEEQQRIVERVSELMAKIDEFEKIEKQLSAIKTAFPQDMRDALLQAAMQGKLTEQLPSDSSVDDLLETIRKEKEQLIKEKKIKKEKPLKPISKDEIPFDIPDSWRWCHIGNLITVKGGKRVPKGKTVTEIPTKHIYIRVTDMKDGSIADDKLRYITDDVYEEIKNYTINKDDLYLTIAGTIGEVGIVPEKFDGMNLTENAVKLTDISINKMYLLYAILSPLVQGQFIDKTNKVAQPKLAIIRIQSTIIPLPPIEEQQRIVKTLEKMLAACEGL